MRRRQGLQGWGLPVSDVLAPTTTLIVEVRTLVADARRRAANFVHAELTMLYWDVGQRIRREILGDSRADYGAHVIRSVADGLVGEFGASFAEKICGG